MPWQHCRSVIVTYPDSVAGLVIVKRGFPLKGADGRAVVPVAAETL